YRTPMILCYLEGRTNEEAARQLQWPVGTLKVRLLRGRQMLRARLVRRGLLMSLAAIGPALAATSAAAQVQAAIIDATVRVALSFGASRAAGAGLVAARVLALTHGVLNTMIWTKLKLLAVVLLVGLVGSGAGLLILHPLLAQEHGTNNAVHEVRPMAANEGQ